MLLGDAGLGTEVETGVRPAPGPGAATDRNPVRCESGHPDDRKLAVRCESRRRSVGKPQFPLDCLEARFLAQGIKERVSLQVIQCNVTYP